MAPSQPHNATGLCREESPPGTPIAVTRTERRAHIDTGASVSVIVMQPGKLLQCAIPFSRTARRGGSSLGGLCCCQRDRQRPGCGGRSGPTGTSWSWPRSLRLDTVLPDDCLAAALAAVVLLSFISLHGIFPIPATMREGRKFLSAFRLPFLPTKRSVREGHALSHSQLLVGCWEQGILT